MKIGLSISTLEVIYTTDGSPLLNTDDRKLSDQFECKVTSKSCGGLQMLAVALCAGGLITTSSHRQVSIGCYRCRYCGRRHWIGYCCSIEKRSRLRLHLRVRMNTVSRQSNNRRKTSCIANLIAKMQDRRNGFSYLSP